MYTFINCSNNINLQINNLGIWERASESNLIIEPIRGARQSLDKIIDLNIMLSTRPVDRRKKTGPVLAYAQLALSQPIFEPRSQFQNEVQSLWFKTCYTDLPSK
jgi:hypothetical protein